jgi:AcrR family transcriptional regulator
MARRKDHTREALTQLAVDCGRELVRDKGTGALTARNVAKAIGYTPGTLYNLFDNIEGLAAAINCVTLKEFAETITAIRARSSTPRKQLENICQAYLDIQQREPALWMLLFATPISIKSADYSKAIHAVFDQVVATIRPLCSNKNTARQDAKIVWSTLHGICLLQQNGKLNVTEADSSETLLHRFLNQFFNINTP